MECLESDFGRLSDCQVIHPPMEAHNTRAKRNYVCNALICKYCAFELGDSEFCIYRAKTGLMTVGCTNRIKRLSVGINDWILTEDLSINK
jgi:hypothetical protein